MEPNKKKLFAVLLTFMMLISAFFLFSYLNNLPRNINIILISIDSLRPDHLGCYGYKRNTSPNIDKLAKEGVLFTQAISQAPWTWPSINSLITSTYPSTNGVYFWDQDLPNPILTLPQILKQKNYCTGFIIGYKHAKLFETTRLKRGFDISIRGETAEQITNDAISWIKKNRNKKLFLWIHYIDVHDRSLGIPIPKEKHLVENMTPEEIKAYAINYDKAISYIDSQIAVLLKNLKILGLYKKTVIIITADHGQEMGEHGLCFYHGGFLYDSLLKVPLILSGPTLFKNTKIVNQQVQHIDIMPTILEILRIKTVNTIEGKSFLSLIEEPEKYTSAYAFGEVKENMGEDEKGNPYYISSGKWNYTQFSVRGNGYKLILTLNNNGKVYELYNLKTDPQELNNLVETEKEQFKILKTKLEEWMNRPKPNIMPLTKTLDEETKESLRSLGYLQ